MLIQYILVIILLASLLLTWKRVRQGVISWREGTAWTLLWVAAGFVIWQPRIASSLAQLLGVGRGVDLALYAAVVLLFLLVFHLHIAHDRLERMLTELVREQALKDLPPVVSNEKER
jgi:small membrane protein